jgi:hypothetical protein
MSPSKSELGVMRVKVADFGTSKICKTEARRNSMTANIGTPIYMVIVSDMFLI